MLNEIDLSRADLNLLVLFDAVLQERHVGRAAMRLRLTPSAVSHGLGRLRVLLNDPLFLKTPKGVVPTTRASELAAPVAGLLAQARSIVATAEPFDPAKSTRRFTIGAPDGVSAVFLQPLLTKLRASAPSIDIAIRQLLPAPGDTLPDRAWQSAIAELEARAMEIAVVPTDDMPVRFLKRTLYEEDFIVGVRAGHPFAAQPTLRRYCDAQHLVVSQTGNAYGFVDRVLAEQGRTRRIALTVPNFMFALAVLAETDLIAALPRRFVAIHAARFNVIGVEPPLPLGHFKLNAVAPRVAMMDAGLAWLFETLGNLQHENKKRPRSPRPSRARARGR
jgi:DNA-binding transcriptional LysR family regulator